MPSGKKSPWFKFYTSDWKAGVSALKVHEKGVYLTLLVEMYEAGGAIPYDIKELALECGISVARLEPVIERLLKKGKLTLRDGMLSNARAETEIADRDSISETRRRAAVSKSETRSAGAVIQDVQKTQAQPRVSGAYASKAESKKGGIPEARSQSQNQNQNNSPNGLSKRARAKPPPSEADFDLFWEAYGKVGSRQQALQKWKAAIKSGHDPTEIIAAARAYRSHLQSPDWEAGGRSAPFQKHGATWLHNHCWQDELEPIPESKNGNRNSIIDQLVEQPGAVKGDLDSGSGGDSSVIDADWRIIN